MLQGIVCLHDPHYPQPVRLAVAHIVSVVPKGAGSKITMASKDEEQNDQFHVTETPQEVEVLMSAAQTPVSIHTIWPSIYTGDRSRLDWLEAHGPAMGSDMLLDLLRYREVDGKGYESLRVAIDVAMQADQQARTALQVAS